MYKPLLRFETEEEQVKDCVIKWAKNTTDRSRERKGLKFTLCYNLRDILCSMIYG